VLIVRNPNNWSCLAACAATITCRPIFDVFDAVGHDGSEHRPESAHPDRRRSFLLEEARHYLSSQGWFMRRLGEGVDGVERLRWVHVGLVGLLPRTGPRYPHWTVWSGAKGMLLETGPAHPVGPRDLGAEQ
jgi:hypothetical protein